VGTRAKANINVWFLALFSAVLSGVLIGLSIFPGPLEMMPTVLVYSLGGTFVVLSGIGAILRIVRSLGEALPRRRTSAFVVLLCVIVTPILLATHVPRRIVFQQYESRFEAMLDDAPPAGDQSVTPLNEDLAIYWVDQWGTDRRGGTYFRTLSTGQRGGTERESFGFAHKPNREGSPFGNTDYTLQHLTGDWYSFSASDGR
jgi:hypothetical protein